MSEAIEKVLKDAARAGEVVAIIYHGGSQPGTLRQIAPISVSGNIVWARSFPQNVVKSFSVSKIAFPDDADPPSDKYDPDFKPALRYKTLSEFFAHIRVVFAMGGMSSWHVAYEKDPDSPNERVGVFAKLKNGNIRKHPTWALHFETNRFDDAGIVERKRKWLVIERNRNMKSFTTLDKAAEAFLSGVAGE